MKKVTWKFGQSKKKQYLCSRFRNERKWATEDCETAWKIVTLKISQLQRKSKIYWKKLLKNLVSPKKSSTFAADFAMNASERLLTAKLLKNVMLKISHLQRKAKNIEKSCLKIWSVQKKAVPLQPISLRTKIDAKF